MPKKNDSSSKLPYEPPRINNPFSSDKTDFLPVMGLSCPVGDSASSCAAVGLSATGPCSKGGSASGDCNDGTSATGTCSPGRQATGGCSTGTSAISCYTGDLAVSCGGGDGVGDCAPGSSPTSGACHTGTTPAGSCVDGILVAATT